MGKINVEFLAADLRAIRDQRKNKRKHCVNLVLERLGYTYSKSISIEQFDAILIRAVDQHLGKSIDADVLLMSFGLLQGYYYNNIKSIGARRVKYLTESNYLSVDSPEDGPYIDATDELKRKFRERLRRAEDRLTESLAMFLSEQKIEDYIKENIAPIVIPQPIYILEKHEPEPAPVNDEDDVVDSEVAPDTLVPSEASHSDTQPTDDNVPEEIDEEAGLPPEDDSVATDGGQGCRSKKTAQADAPDSPPNPQGFRIHIGSLSIGPLINISKKSRVSANLSWVKNSTLLVLAVMVAVVVWVSFFRTPTSSESEIPPEEELSPVEEIFVTSEDVILTPNERFELAAAVLPPEATGAVLSYVSMDTSVVTVRGYEEKC